MIDWLLKRFEPANALDVGTGTGVLAIGIARLRPITVLATDIDPVSVQIARENAAINGVARAIRVVETGTLTHPAIRAGGPYDLVVANILAGPLIDLAPSMSEATSERGAIILSGLLVRQERAVLARYRQLGFVPMRRLHLEGWSTLLLGRG